MSEVRPIDANSLRDEWLNKTNGNIYCPNDMLDSIDYAPALDYAPVIHAKWVKYRNGVGDTEFLTCSHCGFPVEPETKLIDFLHDGRFCLNCGAEMVLRDDGDV